MIPSREDFAETEGPNASLEYGQASEMARQQRSLGTAGGPDQQQQPSQNLSGPPERPSMPSGPPQQPQPQPPRDPMTPDKAQNQVFSDRPVPNIPWRLGISLLEAHPQSGKVIAALARRAREGV